MQLPKFLFINGPAGSGKSTLASLLCSSQPACWRESFAEPIRDMIRTVFFPNDGPLWEQTPDLRDGAVKKRNMLELAGLELTDGNALDPLVRGTMIAFSEDFMKKLFGPQIFGQLLVSRCREQELFYSTFVIDDSGFPQEASYVISQHGASSCALIRLHRDGHSFAGDSRGYISLDGVRSIDLHNNSVPLAMLDQLELEFSNL